MGETQVDGDAARFFFRQAIGISAGERLDQGALSVIDVSGSSDDVMHHRNARFKMQNANSSELVVRHCLHFEFCILNYAFALSPLRQSKREPHWRPGAERSSADRA